MSSKGNKTAAFVAAHHPEKPSARAQTTQGRTWTLSVAIPGSIVTNAQTMELRAWLAGQIARTSAIFSVSEIIVYRDSATVSPSTSHKPRGKYRDPEADANAAKDDDDPTAFLARILEYLETPQYLRKSLFPLHPSLRLAGLLPPLDCPHHLRRDDISPFREGATVPSSTNHRNDEERPKKRKKGSAPDPSEAQQHRVMVDVGLWDPIEATSSIEGISEATRVTLRLPPPGSPTPASIVPPTTPTTESGLYWGYQVRVANSLAAVFTESPYADDGGYDLSIGTSERGTPIEEMFPDLPPFRHLLLAFGPLSGLELTIAADPEIPLEAEEASDLFDHWINVVEGQGSRTVRTEEALPIALARLKSTVERLGREGTAM